MMSLQQTQYRLTLLSDGLQGLGLSMAVHLTPQSDGPEITDLHALRLAHLVECCGFIAEQLSVELEEHLSVEAEQ